MLATREGWLIISMPGDGDLLVRERDRERELERMAVVSMTVRWVDLDFLFEPMLVEPTEVSIVSGARLWDEREEERDWGREDVLSNVLLEGTSAGRLSCGILPLWLPEARRRTRSMKEGERGEVEMVISGGAWDPVCSIDNIFFQMEEGTWLGNCSLTFGALTKLELWLFGLKVMERVCVVLLYRQDHLQCMYKVIINWVHNEPVIIWFSGERRSITKVIFFPIQPQPRGIASSLYTSLDPKYLLPRRHSSKSPQGSHTYYYFWLTYENHRKNRTDRGRYGAAVRVSLVSLPMYAAWVAPKTERKKETTRMLRFGTFPYAMASVTPPNVD